MGDYAQARPIVEALAAEMVGLQAAHPGDLLVLDAASSLLNQLFDFQRLAGEFALALKTQTRGIAVAEALVAAQPANPVWQRWYYLAQGRLADALMDSGDVKAGVSMWKSSISRREAAARADPDNERAPERVNDFASPGVMNLLRKAVVFLGRRSPMVVG